mmetsp:Transcript_16298/g.25182  ORF Transcript_16298/g.25182 Transcript_16298/m.25182 type:complete len:135 (+) Transcript_16298:370-774(+)
MVSSVNIGKNVSIGVRCNIHSCIIDDDCVIGDNVVIQQGARLERGCQILPNSVVKAGALIPAGQVWGGADTVRYVRDLSEEELLQNYTNSYKNGATSHDPSKVWPHEFDETPLGEGEQSLEEYAYQTYFGLNSK